MSPVVRVFVLPIFAALSWPLLVALLACGKVESGDEADSQTKIPHSPVDTGYRPDVMTRCGPEGASIAKVPEYKGCCEGLTTVSSRLIVDPIREAGICEAPLDAVCARCGDGICGIAEDICNCPSDCHDLDGGSDLDGGADASEASDSSDADGG